MKYKRWGYVVLRKSMRQENGPNYINKKLNNFHLSPDMIRMITTKKMGELYV